jgi:LysR family glycine cleavage system transcriptional activator
MIEFIAVGVKRSFLLSVFRKSIFMSASPPLLALRSFVEVGKLGSIKAAAQALHVTSGAISQQIRLLEERVGVALFIRDRYGVRLTDAGQRVHASLSSAFAQIDQAVDTLQAYHRRPTLTISTVATFAASWLIPRLGRFTERYPDIDVRVEATSALVDLRRDGLGVYPELDVTWLMAPVFIPVASPAFVLHTPITTPEDCLQYPLLHDADRADWALWLSAHGVADDARSQRGNSFEDDFLLIRAAEAGQGLALVPHVHAEAEIAAGRLVQVLDKPWPGKFAYYAVTRLVPEQREEVRVFIAWLKAEAERI